MTRFAKIFAAPFAVFLSVAGSANAYSFKSYEGRFSIEFPSQPQAQHIRDIGTCLHDRYEFRVSEGGKTWYASYQDCLPHGYLEDNGYGPFMLKAGEDLAKAVRGELRASDPIEHGALSGRQYLILVPYGEKRVARVQIFIDGDRVYKLMYIGPAFTEEDSGVEAFFASFRVMR